MTTQKLFDPYTVDENKFLLASHLAQGRAWEKGFKPDSNIGKYLLGLACEFYRFQVLLKNVADEFDIKKTNQLLIDWEKSVGLPDSCFRAEGFKTLEERRNKVEQKLNRFGGIQTAADFKAVALAFGITIEVYYGAWESGIVFPIQFPIFFFNFDNYKTSSHTIVITITGTYTSTRSFPLPFPIPFSTGPVDFLLCIFRKLAPANVDIKILQLGA